MSEFDINNYLTKNYLIILDELSSKNKFLNFINYININFEKIKISKLELLIKIILKKLLYFEESIKDKQLEIFYEKIEDEENKDLLDNFINYYDNLNILKNNYYLILFIMISSFKNKYKYLKIDLSKKLDIETLDNLDNLVENDIFKYYNSFFDLNLNKAFFRRLKECKDNNVMIIYTNEMISRLIGLRELFSLDLLKILDIKKIKISEFYELEYLERVNYFLNFYNKTNNLFKIFFKIINFIKRFLLKLNDLTEISQLDYLDSLTDSDDVKPSLFCILNEEEINEVKNLSEEEHIDTPYYNNDITSLFIKSEINNNDESFGESNSSSESDGEN